MGEVTLLTILNRLYDKKFQEKLIDELCFDTDDYEWFYRNSFESLIETLQNNPIERIFDQNFIDKEIESLTYDCDSIQWHIDGKLNDLVDEIKGDVKLES